MARRRTRGDGGNDGGSAGDILGDTGRMKDREREKGKQATEREGWKREAVEGVALGQRGSTRILPKLGPKVCSFSVAILAQVIGQRSGNVCGSASHGMATLAGSPAVGAREPPCDVACSHIFLHE